MPEMLSLRVAEGGTSARVGAAFDTGYEAKFDFPHRHEPPRLQYMIATIPRTGSTYLSHRLWQTGCLGAPLEYLDFSPEGHNRDVASSPPGQVERWQRALATRTSPNGVFGFKCFLMHLKQLGECNEPLLEMLRPSYVVYLERRDRVAQAVSYARAHLTGVWCKEQANGANERVEYSRAALEQAEEWIDAQARGWKQLFERLELAPLHLCYEDVVANPDAATRAVADHIGVELSGGAAIRVPSVARQSGAESEAWSAAYAREAGAAQAAAGASGGMGR
jgi:trehalose 2-sulfotransferase